MVLHVILNARNFYQKENKSITISRETEDGKTLEKKKITCITEILWKKKMECQGKKENCLFSAKHTNKYQSITDTFYQKLKDKRKKESECIKLNIAFATLSI